MRELFRNNRRDKIDEPSQINLMINAVRSIHNWDMNRSEIASVGTKISQCVSLSCRYQLNEKDTNATNLVGLVGMRFRVRPTYGKLLTVVRTIGLEL